MRPTSTTPSAPARPPSTTAGARSTPSFGPRAASVLATLVLLALVALGTAPVAAAWTANSYSSASEQQLFALTNQARSSAGLRTLKWDSSLASIARWRSKDMITRDYFSHNIPPSGEMVFGVMSDRGYCFHVAGENIGWNTWDDTAEATRQIQQAFMNSAGHRANILGKDWDVMAVGAYEGSGLKKMWTVLFADKCGSAPAPKPSSKPTPRPTAEPRPKPKPSPAARSTPKPTPKPTARPAASVAPTPTPSPTPLPSVAPAPVATPTPSASPEASAAGGPVTDAANPLGVRDAPATGGLFEAIVGDLQAAFFGT